MGKTIIITEAQFERLSKDIVEEGLLDKITDPIKNRYYGLKGVFKGYGYDYFKMGSELKNIVRDLKAADRPNEKMMIKLRALLVRAQGTNMRPELKTKLINAIKGAILGFDQYRSSLDVIWKAVNMRLTSKQPSP